MVCFHQGQICNSSVRWCVSTRVRFATVPWGGVFRLGSDEQQFRDTVCFHQGQICNSYVRRCVSTWVRLATVPWGGVLTLRPRVLGNIQVYTSEPSVSFFFSSSEITWGLSCRPLARLQLDLTFLLPDSSLVSRGAAGVQVWRRLARWKTPDQFVARSELISANIAYNSFFLFVSDYFISGHELIRMWSVYTFICRVDDSENEIILF